MKNEPAFPGDYAYDGMSKRFYAACAAMSAIINDSWRTQEEMIDRPYSELSKAIAEDAFIMADAMLKYEREHPEVE